jgi:hypothetical protein
MYRTGKPHRFPVLYIISSKLPNYSVPTLQLGIFGGMSIRHLAGFLLPDFQQVGVSRPAMDTKVIKKKRKKGKTNYT